MPLPLILSYTENRQEQSGQADPLILAELLLNFLFVRFKVRQIALKLTHRPILALELCVNLRFCAVIDFIKLCSAPDFDPVVLDTGL